VHKVQAVLTVPKTAVTGIPITISDLVTGTQGEVRTYGVTHFALGDGSEHNGTAQETFSYTYAYPGTYMVTFEYRPNSYLPVATLTEQATITVSDPSVVISQVLANGSIELTNKGKRDADLSGWLLGTADAKTATTFRVPDGTQISAGNAITFPESVTHIPTSISSLALMIPSGVSAAVYGDIPPETVATPVETATLAIAPVKSHTVSKTNASAIASVGMSANVLGIMQEAEKNTESSSQKRSATIPVVIVVAGIIALGGIVVYKMKFVQKIRELSVAESGPSADTEPLRETVRIVEE
jgi:hypothetical protein